MEQKSANIQTAFDLLSSLVLKHHSSKKEHAKGDNAHSSFSSESNSNERKILTHQEIINRIAEQIVLVQRIKIVKRFVLV